MGGLINSSTVKGDLWIIEAGGNLACYPVATTAEAPGPRVGHSSLLVGNAFIVYGGDTKIDESDILDETLYLLNTSTLRFSISSQPDGFIPPLSTPFPTRHLLAANTNCRSYEAMVSSPAGRPSAIGPLRAFVEHLRIENLHLRWSGGGILHE